MASKSTTERAKEDLKEGKAPSTAAGEFVREEIEHVREGKHGARSPKQAIAIGLNKARRAGIALKPPRKGRTSEKTRKSAERSYEKGQSGEARRLRRALRERAKPLFKRNGAQLHRIAHCLGRLAAHPERAQAAEGMALLLIQRSLKTEPLRGNQQRRRPENHDFSVLKLSSMRNYVNSLVRVYLAVRWARRRRWPASLPRNSA